MTEQVGIKSQLTSIILQLLQRKEKEKKKKEAPMFKGVQPPKETEGQGLLSNLLRG